MESTIKIGGHTFTIIQKDLGEQDLGETNWDKGIIAIHKPAFRSIKESALLHEILHVINPTMDTSEDGHRILESLSEQLYQVLSENHLIDLSPLLGRE